jgi:hypothetical protein
MALGKAIDVGSPRSGLVIDRRTSRISEAEEPGDLVERLTGRVVDGLAEQSITAVVAHLDQHGVAAGDQQHDQRQLQGLVLEERRVQVCLHVVHADERHAPCHRQRLGGRHADQQRTHQTRADRARHRVDATRLDTRLDDRSSHDRVEQIEMGAAGDLRDDTPVLGVQVDLCRDDARQHVVTAHHQCSGGLVATRFDAEDDRVLVDAHPCLIALSSWPRRD